MQPRTAPAEEPPRVKDLTLGGTLPAPIAAPATANIEPFASAASEGAPAPAPTPSGRERAPSAAEIEAAARSIPIVMYSTAWCSACRNARAFLAGHGFAFREVDIEQDQAARAEVKRRTGKTAVPVLEIDGEMGTPGFSEASTAQAIAAGVERRLGVTGIQVQRVQGR